MINWDSLTMEKITINQSISRLDILLIVITIILPLTIIFLLFNKGKEFSLKEFGSFMFWSILLISILNTLLNYNIVKGGREVELYKINFEITDSGLTPKILSKTKDNSKLKRIPFESVIFSNFKYNSTEFYFKDEKLYANIYMYVSDYKYIKNISVFKKIVTEYTKNELDLRKKYKSPEDIEQDNREMEEFLKGRLVNNDVQVHKLK